MSKTIIIKRVTRLFFGVGILTMTACTSDKKETPIPNQDSAVAVTVALPSGIGQGELNISGQIEASQTANISTRIMGMISMIKVKVGDHVRKGQLLITISSQEILAKRAQTDAMITEAQSALNNAQKDLDRFTVLYKQQSATAKELDNVTLQYNTATARLEAARQMRNEVNANLAYSSLTAPFTGVITQKLADAGSIASPGMPLLTIEQSGSYQVSAAVPENAIADIRQGASARVTIKSVNKIIPGIITQISTSSQYSGGQYIIKVSIPDGDKAGLYAGMYADISIPVKSREGALPNGETILVPLSSIHYRDQLTGIYTIGNSNTALLRWVRLGKTYGDKVEVLTGLAKNEEFISRANGTLYNGVPVKTGDKTN